MKYALYMHSGSGNHGCEALVRTIYQMLPENAEVKVFSRRPEEDKKYIGDLNIDFVECGNVPSIKTIKGLISAIKIKIFHRKYAFVVPAYAPLFKYADEDTLALSIGGDNYCYDGLPEVMDIINNKLKQKKARTALIGCSIEPDLLKKQTLVNELSKYDFITARESVTCEALLNSQVKTSVYLIPDTAFMLKSKDVTLPEGFVQGNTVGINISPLICEYSETNNIIINAYVELIKHIICNTDMQIALIPHVVWEKNNDNYTIDEIYREFKNSDRVIRIEDCSAIELKGYISRCRFFVGARTHATIAAYSSGVPTLVVGYSVKSCGIDKDLFGEENSFLISVKNIRTENALVNEFNRLIDNENKIKNRLKNYLPLYTKRIQQLNNLLDKGK